MAVADNVSRRDVLAGAGAGAVVLALAACSSDGAPSRAPTADVEISSGTDLAGASDVPLGGAVLVTVEDAPVLVTQPETGEILAFSAVCTHQRCTVNPGDGELLCPCHQSRYDLATGDVLGGPARLPLPSIPVVVEDGRVVTV